VGKGYLEVLGQNQVSIFHKGRAVLLAGFFSKVTIGFNIRKDLLQRRRTKVLTGRSARKERCYPGAAPARTLVNPR